MTSLKFRGYIWCLIGIHSPGFEKGVRPTRVPHADVRMSSRDSMHACGDGMGDYSSSTYFKEFYGVAATKYGWEKGGLWDEPPDPVEFNLSRPW